MLRAAVFWVCVLTGLSVLFIGSALPLYEHNMKLGHRLDVEEARYEREAVRHGQLASELEAAHGGDPFFFEVMARRHLRMRRMGEEVSAAPVTEKPLPEPTPSPISQWPHYRLALGLVSDAPLRGKLNASALLLCALGVVLGRPKREYTGRPVPAEFVD